MLQCGGALCYSGVRDARTLTHHHDFCHPHHPQRDGLRGAKLGRHMWVGEIYDQINFDANPNGFSVDGDSPNILNPFVKFPGSAHGPPTHVLNPSL
jgi:hypothetical protein